MADDTLTRTQVAALIKGKTEELGGPLKAGQEWGCTPQMVNLVIRGQRNPTASMLTMLQLQEVKAETTYRRVG